MNKLKVLSLFSGIGAFEKALTNIGVNYEVVNYCDVDKYASKCYSIIHNIDETLNLWDITKINIDSLPNFNLLFHGSPCQDYSIAGKQQGGDKGSNTRSSLMWYTVEIIKAKKPKYVIWENVKNVLGKSHIHNFDMYLNDLASLGYKSYYKVINSNEFGSPQNRERVFVISILGEHDPFVFPSGGPLNISLKNALEDCVNEKFFVNKPFFLIEKGEVNSACKLVGKLDIKGHDYIKRIYSVDYCSPTLPTGTGGNHEPKILLGDKVRKLTPLEYWRLQKFDDEDFYKCKNNKISNSQLYKLAGNSITVTVLEEIFKSLFRCNY